jgi:iron complex transport system substrate-binding protein
MKKERSIMMKRKLVLLMVVMILSLSLFTGCGVTNSGAHGDNTSTEVTVTDMAGRTVTLPSKMDSIATFGAIGVLNTFVELFGCGDKICNDMSARFTKTDKWKMQYEFAPQIKDAPVLQNADDEVLIEEVLKVQPDVCFVMSKDLIEPLEKNGLNVIYFEWAQTEDVKNAVTLMGEVLGKQNIAADYIEYFDNKVEKAEALTADIKKEDKKTVLYGNITKLSQPHIIAEWWIDAAGGKSVTDNGRDGGGSFEYSIEDILVWNPEVMIVTDKGMIDEIKQESRYKDIPAVKNDEIYYIPTVAHVWGNRTVEQPLGVFWTLHKLYPDLISYEELSEEIKYFYNHFFKYDLSDKQINSIINSNN